MQNASKDNQFVQCGVSEQFFCCALSALRQNTGLIAYCAQIATMTVIDRPTGVCECLHNLSKEET